MSFCTGEYADVWLKKTDRFLDRQDSQIHVVCLGPFLLGLNKFVTEPWIQALKEVKLLEAKRSVGFLTPRKYTEIGQLGSLPPENTQI